MLKQVVRNFRPDILIVSGDLANQPVPWQMKKAAKIVRDIQQECANDHPIFRTIVIPGNHDFKYWGNIGLRRLTRVPFEIYFRRDGLSHGFWWRVWMAFKLRFQALWWWTAAMREPLIFETFPRLGLALFAINSNTLTEMMAAGKVESADLQQLYARHDQHADHPQFAFLYKIAVVHHHPAPISDAPSDALARLQDSFMIFYNAGLFLRELSRRGFNLVLHGHKHVAGFLRVSCEFSDLGRTELPIAAAGAATHPHPDDSRGNHLHMIEIYDDDTARLTSWFFSADVQRKDPETVRYALDTIEDVRRRRYVVFRRLQNYSCQQVTKAVEMTVDGYTAVEIDFRGCRVFSDDGLANIPLSLTCERPCYLRGVETAPGSSAFIDIKPAPGNNLYAFRGNIDLGHRRTPDLGLFDYGYRYRLMNGHALSAEEFPRHYWGTPQDSEYASITCDGAFDQLILNVRFPQKYDLNSLEFDAIAEYVPAPLEGIDDKRLDLGQTVRHDQETNRVRGYLRCGPAEVTLTCPQPTPGMIYKIRWRFRNLAAPPGPDLAAAANVDVSIDRLLRVAKTAQTDPLARADWNRARSTLDALASEINQTLPPVNNELLRVSVMVFDKSSQRLRFVGSNTDPHELPAGDFISGEGCAGFAFEKLRCVLYHPAKDTLGYFIGNAERSSSLGPDPVVMASFPWIYDYAGGQIPVGVVNVSSLNPASKLLPLFDVQEPRKVALMRALQELVAQSASQLLTI